MQLENTRAETLFSDLNDFLIQCLLPINLCRGQAYDGASNMSGVFNGVHALYVHCLAHMSSLNLCVHQETSKQCVLVQGVIEMVYDLIKLIKFSPKCFALFENLRTEVSMKSGETLQPSLRTLCPTRWTVRTKSLESILSNYEVLQQTLNEIQQGMYR